LLSSRAIRHTVLILAFATAWLAAAPARSDGPVVGWGNSQFGQTAPPAAVTGTAGTATAISAGGFHSCAIQAGTGNVVCWGAHHFLYEHGQATPPASVNGAAGTATAIAAGSQHSCAIQAGTGKVVCWGLNNYGQATPPASVDGTIGRAIAIAAGWAHTLAIATPEPSAALLSAASLGSLLALARWRRLG